MNFAGTTLHWIRPELLWTGIPLLICALLLTRQHFQQRSWQKHIDPTLLPYLLEGKPKGAPRRSALVLLLCATLMWLALLGPAWEKVPTPLYKNTDGLVVVLDLSPSMLAEDIQPSRMRQARFKLRDILQLRSDGQTGLVVFAGDAFVVAPLTDDVNTLLTLIPGLNPSMMPMPGSNPLAGVTLAKELLDRSGGDGSILLISDGVNSQQLDGLSAFISKSDCNLSVLAVGTPDGAPIPLPGGGFARDNAGNIIVPALTTKELQSLAAAGNGHYRELSLDDADIKGLSVDTASSTQRQDEATNPSERNYDQWKDAGPWLVLLLLPLALIGFRKSWLATLLPLLLPMLIVAKPNSAQAFEFADLWQTPDQQAAALLDTDPQAAADKFQDPMWKASAQYRAGDFEAAANNYAQFDTGDAHYNRGNALAKAGKLDEAIAAYDAALEKTPSLEDATKNKALLEQLKDQQENQQQQSQDGDDSQENQQNQQGDQNQSNQNSSNQNSDSQDQQDQQADSNEQSQNQDGQPSSQDDSQQNSPDSQQNQDSSSNDQGSEQNNAEQQQNEENESEQQNPQSQAEQEEKAERNEQLAEDYARQAAERNEAVQKALEAQQQQSEQADSPEEQAAAVSATDEPLSEEDQAREQWLRKIPDNPGNLLRNKFRYQHLDRQQRGEQPGTNEDYAPY